MAGIAPRERMIRLSATDAKRPEIRSTKQRRAIARALQNTDDFISTQQLHRRLQERGETVSLATTYRILQSMADNAEVDMLRNEEGEAIYRQCEAEHHHHHLVCRCCGAAVELEEPAVERWAEDVARSHGYVAADHTVEITGVCPECAATRST